MYHCFTGPQGALSPFLENVRNDWRIIAPMPSPFDKGHPEFRTLKQGETPSLFFATTANTPQHVLFFPEELSIVHWEKKSNGNGHPHTEYHRGWEAIPTLLLGARPYDVAGFQYWDHTMNRGAHPDPWYAAQRAATLIVAMDMTDVPPGGFTEDMHTTTSKKGWDLLLTDLGDGRFFIEVGSNRGAFLINKWEDKTPADRHDDEARRQVREKMKERLRAASPMLPIAKDDIPAFMLRFVDHPIWNELGEDCLSCTKCTEICPTCTCFRMEERVALDGQSGDRVRVCDSCQYHGYTQVAGGFTRATCGPQTRHRILDKLAHRHEVPTCVGCGRCVSACPTDIASPHMVLARLLATQTQGGIKE